MQQNLFCKNIVRERQFQLIALSKSGILTTYENQALGPRRFKTIFTLASSSNLATKFGMQSLYLMGFKLRTRKVIYRNSHMIWRHL